MVRQREAEENIQAYRNLISQVEKEVYRLQKIMAQQALNKKTKEEMCRVLDTIRDINLKNVSFNDKQNLIAKLGIKVYPSEDWCNIKVTTAIDLASLDGDRASALCYKINIASPKL